MAHVCSKRSKQINANARLVVQSHEFGTLEAGWSSITSKSFDPYYSPLPSWWDDIYDAHDLSIKVKKQLSAKRKLFISPVKDAVTTISVDKISPGCDIEEAPIKPTEISDPVSHVGVVVCGVITNNHVAQLTSFVQENFHTTGAVERRHKKKQEVCNLTLIDGENGKYVATNDATNTQPVSAANLSCPEEHLPVPKADEYTDLSTLDNSSMLECISNNFNVAASSPVKCGTNVKNKFPSHKRIEEAKLALNSGREHITPKGKVRKARSIRQSCLDTCKRCQHPRLTNTERLCLNEKFWNLKNHVEQWMYILKSIKIYSPKKKFVMSGTKGEKLSSRGYFFLMDGQCRKVCKTMFKSTLCICDSWIDSAISHRSDSTQLQEDKRGKHMNRPKRRHKL